MRKLPHLMLLTVLASFVLAAQSAAKAAPLGALAITDTPSPTAPLATDTPTATPTNTPEPTPTAPAPTDPGPSFPPPAPGGLVIVKTASVAQASVGDQVDFTLVVSNPHAVAVADAVVMDTLAAELDFLGASTPQGSFAYSDADRTVTFALGEVAPGQTLNLTIMTRVNPLAQPSGEIRNVARASLGPESNTTVVVVVPATLPSTGAGPGRQELLNLAAAAAGAVLLAVAGRRAWQRARR